MTCPWNRCSVLITAAIAAADGRAVRQLTGYAGLAGKITKQAGSGNLRSAPAVWVIKNGKPTLLRR